MAPADVIEVEDGRAGGIQGECGAEGSNHVYIKEGHVGR